jgi:hypothetical protein
MQSASPHISIGPARRQHDLSLCPPQHRMETPNQPRIRNAGKLAGLGGRPPFALVDIRKIIFMGLTFHPFPEQIGQPG